MINKTNVHWVFTGQYQNILTNKMHSGRNLDIQQYCSQMDQSIAFHDEDLGQQSPIIDPNSTISLNIPKSSTRDIYNDMNQTTSIQEEFIGNHSIRPQKQYKCFKCYGKNSHTSMKCNGPICHECEGTQYISDNHALANILDQLLMMKIPQLPPRTEENVGRSNHELNYGRNSMKQQNFHYQGDSSPHCKTCGKDCDDCSYRICSVCDNFVICSDCFRKGKINHRSDHMLMKVLNHQNNFPSLSGLSHHPPNMKKISQEGESQEMSNYLQQQQKCQNCNQSLEQIYINCATCEKEGQQYILCSNCSDNKSYIHNANHKMEMKTISKDNKLTRLISKPSQAQSIAFSETKKVEMPSCRNSIIKINNIDLQSSYEFNSIKGTRGGGVNILESFCKDFSGNNALLKEDAIQEEVDPIFGQTFTPTNIQNFDFLFESHKINSGANNHKNPQQSVIRIDMEGSVEFESKIMRDSNKTELFTPFSFASKSQIKNKDIRKSNPQDQYIFNNYQCDICNTYPIKNKRYHCKECQDYDLCEICYLTQSKKHVHQSFEEIDGRLLLKKQKDLIQTKLLQTTTRDFSKKMPSMRNSSLK